MPAALLRRFTKTFPGKVAALAGAAFLLYLAWQFALTPSPAAGRQVSSLAVFLYAALAGAFGLRLAWPRGDFDPRLRRAWLFFALAALGSGLAEALGLVLEVLPGPGVLARLSHGLSLIQYPLRLAGITALPYVALRRTERVTLWLDLAILLTAGMTGLWYFIAAPSLLHGASALSGLISLAIPLGDLVLIAGLAVLIHRDLERMRLATIVFLALSGLLLSGADLALAASDVHGLPRPDTWIRAVWVGVSLCDLLAVTWLLGLGQHPARGSLRPSHPARRMIRLSLPYAATLLGMAVLVAAVLQRPLDPPGRLSGTLLGALSLVGLAMLRQSIVLRENILLQEEANRLATTDSLTGLSNRRALDEMLEREVERALRFDHPLSIVLLDLDGFKAYNDRHGHLQGDAALRRVAMALHSQIRSIDLLARFGGDEFVLLLPETGWQGARAVGAKMQAAIRKQPIPGSPVTLSVGVAEFSRGMGPADLLDAADRALYRDKRVGHQTEPGPHDGGTKPLQSSPLADPDSPTQA